MRTAFIEALEQHAEADQRVCLVVGDLGFGVVTNFSSRFPRQFLNVGVAEQNMTGIAAGMAMSGRIVFTYSIANFPTLRPLEQVRNDVCYHNANVKVVSVGGGFAYGALGPTHFATEDMATMRVLPNMVVVAPGDPHETRSALQAVIEHDGPVYLRLGRAGEPSVHEDAVEFRIGKAMLVRPGSDITLLTIGGMANNAKLAAQELAKFGIEARVLSMGTLKPIDTDAIVRSAQETGAILTIEEHSVIGGLGSAVAEVLAEARLNPRFKRLGVPSQFPDRVGDQDWFLTHFGLSVPDIVRQTRELLASSG